MKLTKYFMPVAAVALLASCSDNQGVDTPDQSNKIESSKAYAMISINMSGSNGTRAESSFADGGYDNGTDDEAKVTDIQLALYDEYGSYVGKGTLKSELNTGDNEGTVTPNTSHNQSGTTNVSDTYSKYFELDLLQGANEPTQVVAFINKNAETLSLEALKAKTYTDYLDSGNFIMTNSGYSDSDKDFVAAKFDFSAAFSDTEDASTASIAATIYVERVAAKITVSNAQTITQDPKYTVKDVAGNAVKLNFTPTAWVTTGLVGNEYSVKKEFTSVGTWAETSDFRTYWAEGTLFDLASWEDFYDSENGAAKENTLTYKTFGEIAGANKEVNNPGESEYVLEHTSSVQSVKGMDLVTNTYVIVTGNYSFEDSYSNASWFTSTDEQSQQSINFYLLLDGLDADGNYNYIIYNKSQLIGLLLSYNGILEVSESSTGENPFATVVKDNTDFTKYFDVTMGEEGKYVLSALENGATDLYAKSGDAWSKIEVANLEKSTNSRQYFFPDGGAFFNVPITQYSSTSDGTFYGIVRNHSYKLTISKIENLGAPLDENVWGEDEPLVPDPTDDSDHIIKAEINVLSWHVVNNDVTL